MMGFVYIEIFLYLCSRFILTSSSAVGSAPRSGRGGRAFESPLLDKEVLLRPALISLRKNLETVKIHKAI